MPLSDLKQLKTHIISLRGVLKNGGHTQKIVDEFLKSKGY